MVKRDQLTGERHPFKTPHLARQYLIAEGFACVLGCWMRGQNEFAQLEGNRQRGVVVRIGKVL